MYKYLLFLIRERMPTTSPFPKTVSIYFFCLFDLKTIVDSTWQWTSTFNHHLAITFRQLTILYWLSMLWCPVCTFSMPSLGWSCQWCSGRNCWEFNSALPLSFSWECLRRQYSMVSTNHWTQVAFWSEILSIWQSCFPVWRGRWPECWWSLFRVDLKSSSKKLKFLRSYPINPVNPYFTLD